MLAGREDGQDGTDQFTVIVQGRVTVAFGLDKSRLQSDPQVSQEPVHALFSRSLIIIKTSLFLNMVAVLYQHKDCRKNNYIYVYFNRRNHKKQWIFY